MAATGPAAGQQIAYERGNQAILFAAASAAAGDKQVGSAAPVNATVYALPPTVSRGQLPFNFAVQVDPTGTVTTLEVDVLGSLDGVNFYIIQKITLAGGSLNFVGGAALRYLSAAVPTLTGGGTVKVSFAG